MRVKMDYQTFVARMQAAGATIYQSTPCAETWANTKTATVKGHYYHTSQEAEPLDYTRQELEDYYGLWLAENNLPDMCAMELVMELGDELTAAQTQWLSTFMLNWNRMEQIEKR